MLCDRFLPRIAMPMSGEPGKPCVSVSLQPRALVRAVDVVVLGEDGRRRAEVFDALLRGAPIKARSSP
jgi:hypothetical protein